MDLVSWLTVAGLTRLKGPQLAIGRWEMFAFPSSSDPVFAAGLLDRIELDLKLCDEVWLEQTPEHASCL